MNALIGLASLGPDTTWLTRLVNNPLGRQIAAHAMSLGVHTHVDWDASARTSLYFVEHGSPPRPSEVLYDRRSSAMRALGAGTFDWKPLVAEANAVLYSGITCALGVSPTAAVQALFAHAHDIGACTVFDVNHRARMWGWEVAAPVLRTVLPSVDILLASSHDLTALLGPSSSGRVDEVQPARAAIDRYGHRVVLVRQAASGRDGHVAVQVTAVTANVEAPSSLYEVASVDPFGAGDAALAACLARYLDTGDVAAGADNAARESAFQHTVPGDAWGVRASDLLQRPELTRRILR